MIPPGTKVLCAVSGGADSVALLHFLSKMEDVKLAAAHYNHCLRGTESDADEEFVKTLCGKLGIECVTGRGDVAAYAAESGKSTEEAARTLRYEFLEKTARELGCSCIATAHNADDNAETVLLNLTRGTGLKGLCGIPPVRGKIIRPFLQNTREEIEHYLEQNGLEHIEDSSNALDDYSRNRIRHYVSPVLRQLNPSYTSAIARMTESLREDEEYISSAAAEFIGRETKGRSLSVDAVMALESPVRMRVFRLMHGGELSAVHCRA
ncbi:MAG: tRNA lysidine(34) synthetase TilS, partial [Oscillospiraceae bacterium]|nr:tRNA lysidine(34) synthetase TilS [Oscillospiraceae bacterium]